MYEEKRIKKFLQESNRIEGVFSKEADEDALIAWGLAVSRDKVTPQLVKDVHSQLMLNQLLEEKYIGEFRDIPIYVGRKEQLPHPFVPELISEWCDRMNEHDKEHDEVELHILFEGIHPFVDGNGRVGRIFFNWLRQYRGEEVKIFYEEEKQEYYQWFK